MIVNDKINAINNLDLSQVKSRLALEDRMLNQVQIDIIEREYKRFLMLVLLYPQEQIVPNEIVDVLWHYHILDTKKYFNDTNSIFGGYLHHNPNIGRGTEKDKKRLYELYEKTCELYQKEFGVSLNSVMADCDSNCSGSFCATTSDD